MVGAPPSLQEASTYAPSSPGSVWEMWPKQQRGPSRRRERRRGCERISLDEQREAGRFERSSTGIEFRPDHDFLRCDVSCGSVAVRTT